MDLGDSLGYRFGFGGQEMDDEMKGSGNSINFKHRMYNPRVGRFFLLDPIGYEYPYYSPYQYSGNMPVFARDLEGLQPEAVLNESERYVGTPYEWGGKLPHPNALQMASRVSGSAFFEHLVSSVLSVKPNPRSAYSTHGYGDLSWPTSIGVDCSGLACLGFNADQQKLMGDLPSGRAVDQAKMFFSEGQAGADATGVLHQDFNQIGMGDMVFRVTNSDETGKPTKVPHVMIATGKVRKDGSGNVTSFQILHAPQTGDFVKTEWRSVNDSYQIGHTFRTSDNQIFAGPLQNALDRLIMSDFTENHQETVE